LSRLKDAALEKALRSWLAKRVARYGSLESISINTSEKTVQAEILLLQEAEPVAVAAHYRVSKKGPETWLLFYDLQVSRIWAQHLVEDYFAEVPLKIPDFVGHLIR
jgi:hypothetical protein